MSTPSGPSTSRSRPRPWGADAAPRLLAVAFAVPALLAVVQLVVAWGEPALRTVARLVFILVLLELASLAWRWPKGRARRLRSRARELLTVLATPERQLDFAETSPQVGLAQAILDDWDTLRREQRLLREGDLSDAETAALAAFGDAIASHREKLRESADRPVPELQSQAWWRHLGEGAVAALDAFPEGGPDA